MSVDLKCYSKGIIMVLLVVLVHNDGKCVDANNYEEGEEKEKSDDCSGG